MTTERVIKSFKAQTKVLNAASGLVETVFSVTQNLDRQGDIIEPGAFTKAATKSPTPTVVFSHVWDDVNQVLGKTVSWRELLPGDPGLPSNLQAKGLGGVKAMVKFDLETPAGQVAFTHVKNDNLKEWSFAFDIDKDGAEFRDHKSADGSTTSARHIKSISELFEVSLVLVGANPATSTVGWKSGRKSRAAGGSDAWLLHGIANALVSAAARKDAKRASSIHRAPTGPGTWLSSLAGRQSGWIPNDDD